MPASEPRRGVIRGPTCPVHSFHLENPLSLKIQVTMGGRPEQAPARCGLFGSFLPGPGSGMAFALSRKAMGSGEPGQRPELWVLVFPLLLFHDPSSPWKPIWDMLAWGTFAFTKHLFTDYFVLSSLQSCGSGTLINIFF